MVIDDLVKGEREKSNKMKCLELMIEVEWKLQLSSQSLNMQALFRLQ